MSKSELNELNSSGLTFQLSDELDDGWEVKVFGISKTATQVVPGSIARNCATGEDYYLDTIYATIAAFQSALLRKLEGLTNKKKDVKTLKDEKQKYWNTTWKKQFIAGRYFQASKITVTSTAEGADVVLKLEDFEWSSEALSKISKPDYISSETLHKNITAYLDAVRECWRKTDKKEDICIRMREACNYFIESIPNLEANCNAQDQHLSHALHEMFDMLSNQLHIDKPINSPQHKLNLTARSKIKKRATVLANKALPLFEGQRKLLNNIDDKNFRSYLKKPGVDNNLNSETEEKGICISGDCCVNNTKGKPVTILKYSRRCKECVRYEGDLQWNKYDKTGVQTEQPMFSSEILQSIVPKSDQTKVEQKPELELPEDDVLWAERILKPYDMSRLQYKNDAILLEDIDKLRDNENNDHVDVLIHALQTLRGLDDVDLSTLPPMEGKVTFQGQKKVKKGKNKGKTVFKL